MNDVESDIYSELVDHKVKGEVLDILKTDEVVSTLH